MELVENFVLDEGVDAYGVRKQVIFEGDQAVTKLTYDAAPLLDTARAERTATAGDRWGEMRKVGTIPMVELNRINAAFPGAEDRKIQVLLWLKAHPALVTFDKFLK
jgi:pyocin large subunit-like protein